MKKVTVFVGSAHHKNTHEMVDIFVDHLKTLGDVDCEIITLSDYQLGICRGCRLCFEKGESFCPLRDDRDILFEKISASDGIILATPNYSFQLSGLMKVFLDRFGFVFHRPRYFGKVYTSIVSQGIGGGNEIVKYLDFFGTHLGFNVVSGSCLTALDPRTQKEQQKMERILAEQSQKFYAWLQKPAYPVPTLFKLMLFRMGRTSIKQMLDERSCDYRYYAAKGWFESQYYYPTRLNPFKKAAGFFFDQMASTVRNLLA
ncbi:MAG: flavodoxin family protein [Anaerolineae bacterium]|nr:flavodoxin family protein [Anaerolineae bacterium]